jgi:predicted small lipoprotein YifL
MIGDRAARAAVPRATGGDRARARARLVLAAMLLALALPLAGCGKKGQPEPPPGQPNTFPRTYPSG